MTDLTRFAGSLTALATPFWPNDLARIDEARFAAFVEEQIAQGTRGLVPGTIVGEGPTLAPAERERLIRMCVEVSAGRAPVIAGTVANGTDKAVALTRAAKAAGADAALVVVPFYNKPTQRGVVAHVEAVARAVDLPLLVHNDPARCVVDLAPETVAALARLPGVTGIIDATGDPARVLGTALAAGNRYLQLSGHDATAVSFNLAGGRGCVSSLANVAPRLCSELQAACARDDWLSARRLQARLAPLARALDGEGSPARLKQALALQHGWASHLRLPLVAVSPTAAQEVRAALQALEGSGELTSLAGDAHAA